jgi:hypothetical protein
MIAPSAFHVRSVLPAPLGAYTVCFDSSPATVLPPLMLTLPVVPPFYHAGVVVHYSHHCRPHTFLFVVTLSFLVTTLTFPGLLSHLS